MKKFYFALPMVFALILAACATPPTEEMNRAHNAVIRAENDADAVAYAPILLVRARDALVRMQADADARNFASAGTFAAEAINLAERAILEGRSGAARAREEAMRLINGLAAPLAETEAAVNAARDQALLFDYDALRDEMALTRQVYDDATRNLEADNFQDAIAQGQIVRGNLSDINAQLTEAAQAVSRKRK